MSYLRANQNVALIREQIITRLMPNTCYIAPSAGSNPTFNPLGYVTTDTPTLKQWRGSEAIPCRFDNSRAFRPDNLDAQVVIVNEYNLQLPFDLDVDEDDKVFFKEANGNVEIFEIRKLKRLSDWSYTVEALILQADTDYDLDNLPTLP